MDITVGSRVIAAVRRLHLNIRPILGAYEIQLSIDLVVHPADQAALRSSVIGATITVRGRSNSAQLVGFARPESAFNIIQYAHSFNMNQILSLPIQSGQLAAIERLRDREDLFFELLVAANGVAGNGEQATQDKWQFTVPRSEWLDKLRGAGARDVFLLEVPLPLIAPTDAWISISHDLGRAEMSLRDGDYKGCVSACRLVLDEIGIQRFGMKDWATPLLERLANNRAGMTTAEREGAIWAVARHYTHQSHHTESDGGLIMYSRSDAQFVLSIVAVLLGHVEST